MEMKLLLEYIADYRITGLDGITDVFIVRQELLWVRHRDSSRIQRNGNVRRWKPVPDDW
jgi:hypothetical protein